MKELGVTIEMKRMSSHMFGYPLTKWNVAVLTIPS